MARSASHGRHITERKLLLSEGPDDGGFFQATLEHLGIQGVQIWPDQGKRNLTRAFLEALRKSPRFSTVSHLLVTRDSDDSPVDTIRSIRAALSAAGLPAPASEAETACSEGDLKIGVYLLPALNAQGEIEDLCLEAVKDHPVMGCVGEYVECLQKRLQSHEFPKKPTKAKIPTFLAGMPEFKYHIGNAAQKGYIPVEHAAFAELRTFLVSFFADEPPATQPTTENDLS